MQHLEKNRSFNSTAIVTSESGVKVNLDNAVTGSLQIIHGANVSAVVTASAAIDVTANSLTSVAHGLVTGTKGQFTTSSALPTGISALTDYFIIKIDADIFKVATSYNLAVAGTPVDITAAGTGNQTFTASTKAGSLQIKVSNADTPGALTTTNWVSKGAAISISGAAASSMLELDEYDLSYKWLALDYTHTGGQFALETILNLKG
jgi:hypothetical protein